MSNHIPVDVVRKFRDSLADKTGTASFEFHRQYPDFCDKSIDYFEKMGHFAENAATKDDLSEHVNAVKDVLNRQTERIGTHDRRINDLDYRVKHLEQLATHTKISVDANTAISKQTLQLVELASAKIDQLARPKAFDIRSLPAAAWVVIGVISIALISAATGQMGAFIGWLGTVKLFGGA